MPNQIGTVGASRRSIQPSTPNVSSEAFGSGIGQALGQLSQTFATRELVSQDAAEAQQAVSLAWKERNDKLTLANLNVQFLQTENQLSLDLTEKYKNAEPGAMGLTNAAKADVDKAYGEFLSGVPERLKPQFLARVEQSKENVVNAAFKLEIDAGNTEFKRNVGLFQQDAVNKIMTAVAIDPVSIDTVAAKLEADADALFKGSPLAKVETRDLRYQLKVALDTARFARHAQDEAQGLSNNGGEVPGRLRHEGNAWRSQAPVAAGLPAVAVGLLTSISGPESNGDYNVMYSPEGRRYFSDFSKHPNQPALISEGPHKGEYSSAAGKYQFVKGTWDRAQQALGLPDFSPGNQDLGAWYIAQADYKEATGRNLIDVLSSGNVPAIIAAKRVLEKTWAGLKAKSDEQFIADITGATGNPTSLIYDPEFSDIPYDQRVALALDAQSRAAAIQQQINSEATAQRNQAFDQTEKAVASGAFGMADIQRASAQNGFDYDQQQKLEKIFKETNAQAYAAGQFVTSLTTPGYTVSPDDAEGKKNSTAFFAQPDKDGLTADQHLAQGDTDYVQLVLRPVIGQTQFIPPNVVQSLKTYMGSPNQDQALFALDTMNQLRGDNPAEFERAFGSDVNMATSLYNVAKTTMEPGTMLNYMRMQNDPMMKPVLELRKTQIAENVKDNPEDFLPAGIIDRMGFEGTATVEVGNAISAEFWPIYNYMYQATGDHDKAMQGAADILKQRYGDATVNGNTQFMRYPPTITAPVFDGSQDYIDEQLQQSFGLTPEDNVRLVSDSQTEAEFMSGRPASYKLVKFDDAGFPSKVYTQADLPGFDPKTDREIGQRVVRWFPQVTAQMKKDQVVTIQARDEIIKLQVERFTLGDFDPERRKEIDRQIGAAEGRLNFRMENIVESPKLFQNIISGMRPAVPASGSALQSVIDDLGKFKPKSAEEAKSKLQDILDNTVPNIYPVFQRWEIERRIDVLMRELG